MTANSRRKWVARDPRIGKKVMGDERFKVTFKPGRNVEERVAREGGGGAVPESVGVGDLMAWVC